MGCRKGGESGLFHNLLMHRNFLVPQARREVFNKIKPLHGSGTLECSTAFQAVLRLFVPPG